MGIGQENKFKSVSTYDFKSLDAGSTHKFSDENILKTFLPFLDEKKKTLSGTTGKTLPAVGRS